MPKGEQRAALPKTSRSSIKGRAILRYITQSLRPIRVACRRNWVCR